MVAGSRHFGSLAAACSRESPTMRYRRVLFLANDRRVFSSRCFRFSMGANRAWVVGRSLRSTSPERLNASAGFDRRRRLDFIGASAPVARERRDYLPLLLFEDPGAEGT